MPVKPKTKTAAAEEEAQEVRLGLMGSGEIAEKAIKVTLDEAIAGIDGTPHFVVPVTKDLFTDSVKLVVDVLIEREIPYDAVTTPDAPKVRNLKPYLSNAAKTVERQRGFNKFFIQNIGNDGKLLALFDEEDEILDEVMQLAFEAELPVLAFNQGLDELESTDEEPEAEAEDEDEEPEPEKAKPVKAAAETNGVGDIGTLLRVLGQSLIDASKSL